MARHSFLSYYNRYISLAILMLYVGLFILPSTSSGLYDPGPYASHDKTMQTSYTSLIRRPDDDDDYRCSKYFNRLKSLLQGQVHFRLTR